MSQQLIIAVALSCLMTVCSGSFFMFRQQPQKLNTNERQNANSVVLPPAYQSHYNSKDTNNNINTFNTFENSAQLTTTESPSMSASMSASRCFQRSSTDFRPHATDCGKFTMCSAGTLITFSCPQGSVFHGDSKSCVPRGSVYDKCSPAMSAHLICPRGSKEKKAHPGECAQFYHCGAPAQEARWEQHLNECEYPMLFNIATKRCEHYSMVTCGIRREPYDPCDYKVNECGSTHCVPCSVRHPSCRGKKDGMNAWKGREGSPHYVVCASQRVVYHGMCPQSGGTQVFDDVTGTCVMLTAKTEHLRRN